ALEGVVPDPGRRMELDQVEAATRGEAPGDGAGPGLEAREPAHDTVGGEDDVEALAAEQARGVVDGSLHEASRNGELGGEGPRLGDGDVRQVEPGHPRSEARPAQGVLAEVALEVKQGLAADVPHLLELDGLERALPRLERLEVVEARAEMDR